MTCVLCDEPIRWHPGNGGQWLGAIPPRDWASCNGFIGGSSHRPDLPEGMSEEQVRDWLVS